MKRKNYDLAAGSMADIAFLLLIFFLVSTTIQKDKGYIRNMPAKKEGPRRSPALAKNVFEIHINNENQMMVEGSQADHEFLKQQLRAFYLGNSPVGKNAEDQPKWIKSEKFPAYTCLDTVALIKLDAQMKTNYKDYVAIQSDIQEVVEEVRNELAFYYFGTSFDYLKEHKEKEYEKINILKSIVPIRIIESKIDQ
ncbi:MAG: biopolymer transporter ExbD [Crocinitomicaceae bacterium]|nr:biopolymer transporter ExbD [Crocinitomicaceae bacterium]